MYQHRQISAVRTRTFVHRTRFQLGGALLFGAVLPWIVVLVLKPLLVDDALLQNTLVGNILAIVIGHYLFRSLTVYPGIRTSYFILPTFGVTFALAGLGYVLLRLEYSRILLSLGSLACIVWYYAVFFLQQRARSLVIGVVPFGDVNSLDEISAIQWVEIDKPVMKATPAYELVVADFRFDLPDEWERFLADCALSGMTVLHVKQLRESLTGRVEIDHLSENNFGSLIPATAYIKLKGATDIGLALLAGIVLLPLLIAVAGIVCVDSPGPPLFRQRRVGYGGRRFWVYKFRTMKRSEPGDEVPAREQAITTKDDARITRVGRLLRRSRIDELPQIMNILRGEMSWIGPRPEAEVLSKWYESELPFYRYRHIVKPGITGWAQVNQGHVAEVDDVLWKLQYDFYYIKNFSPWLDLLIVFKTLQTVRTGFGAR